MDIHKGQVKELDGIRSNIAELIVLAMVMAMGVNMIAASLSDFLKDNRPISIAIGSFFVLLSCLLILLKLLPSLSRQYKIEGIQVLKGDKKEVIVIDRYGFSEGSKRQFSAIGKENKAIKKLWEDGELSCFKFDSGRMIYDDRSPAVRLQREQIEYFVLSKLSTHLEDHFNSIKDEGVVEFERGDIPAVLLQNRFLELFSRSMEDREAFLGRPHSRAGSGIIVSASGENGEIYDRFNLRLPGRSKVSRRDGIVFIDTPRFNISLKICFDGSGANISPNFAKYYLGEDWYKVDTYRAALEMNVKFKILSMVTPSGWEYYQWVDSFVELMVEEFSFEHFLKNIGWEQSLTTLKSLDRVYPNGIDG